MPTTPKPVMTREVAYALARDAANTAMHIAGRNQWSFSDWKIGCKALAQALRMVG